MTSELCHTCGDYISAANVAAHAERHKQPTGITASSSSIDIARANRSGRIIYEDSMTPTQAQDCAAEVKAIRSELSDIRHRLWQLSRKETEHYTDSTALDAHGAVSCAIVSLYSLIDGPRSFDARSLNIQKLWADLDENPTHYVLRKSDA